MLFRSLPGVIRRLSLPAAPLLLRGEVGAALVDAEGLLEAPSGLLEHGPAALRAVVLHRHVPGHKVALSGLVLAVEMLTAVIGVLLIGLFALLV